MSDPRGVRGQIGGIHFYRTREAGHPSKIIKYSYNNKQDPFFSLSRTRISVDLATTAGKPHVGNKRGDFNSLSRDPSSQFHEYYAPNPNRVHVPGAWCLRLLLKHAQKSMEWLLYHLPPHLAYLC